MNESIVDAHYRIGLSLKEIIQSIQKFPLHMETEVKSLQNEYKFHSDMTLIMRNNLDSLSLESNAADGLIQKRKDFLMHYIDVPPPLMDSTMVYCDEALRLAALGEYDSADNLFQRCVYVRERKFGRNSSHLTPTLFLHAEFLSELGKRKGDISKIDLACLEIERCIAISSSHFGPSDESVQRYYTKLAQIYFWKSEKYNNIEDLLYSKNVTSTLYDIQMASLGTDHKLTKETAVALEGIDAKLSQMQQNREQAALQMDYRRVRKTASLSFMFVYHTEMTHNTNNCQKVLSVSEPCNIL